MNNTIALDLGLSNIEILKFNIDEKGEYHITLQSTKRTGTCHKCGCEIDKFHGLDREMEIRHLPILGKACYLYIRLPRYECTKCLKNPKTTQQLLWREYNSSHTKDFEKYLLDALVNSTIMDVSRKEKISEGKIRRVLDTYYPDRINWNNFEDLGEIGIDEIALKKRA